MVLGVCDVILCVGSGTRHTARQHASPSWPSFSAHQRTLLLPPISIGYWKAAGLPRPIRELPRFRGRAQRIRATTRQRAATAPTRMQGGVSGAQWPHVQRRSGGGADRCPHAATRAATARKSRATAQHDPHPVQTSIQGGWFRRGGLELKPVPEYDKLSGLTADRPSVSRPSALPETPLPTNVRATTAPDERNASAGLAGAKAQPLAGVSFRRSMSGTRAFTAGPSAALDSQPWTPAATSKGLAGMAALPCSYSCKPYGSRQLCALRLLASA